MKKPLSVHKIKFSEKDGKTYSRASDLFFLAFNDWKYIKSEEELEDKPYHLLIIERDNEIRS